MNHSNMMEDSISLCPERTVIEVWASTPAIEDAGKNGTWSQCEPGTVGKPGLDKDVAHRLIKSKRPQRFARRTAAREDQASLAGRVPSYDSKVIDFQTFCCLVNQTSNRLASSLLFVLPDFGACTRTQRIDDRSSLGFLSVVELLNPSRVCISGSTHASSDVWDTLMCCRSPLG